jgi:hypothetical protein
VIIVTSTGDGNVGVTGLARFLAVLTGSAVALLAQWSVDATTQRWLAKFAKPRDGATSASAAPSPASAPGPKPAETE